eukprot:362619-Chlamydomonas_euryale.AAC.10
MCVTLATSAASAGAITLNHAECAELIKNEEGKVWGHARVKGRGVWDGGCVGGWESTILVAGFEERGYQGFEGVHV